MVGIVGLHCYPGYKRIGWQVGGYERSVPGAIGKVVAGYNPTIAGIKNATV
jgi:hypothetical protein